VATQRKSDPRRLSQLVRGELDWIVMKTLEKDRNRRYETANGFAADVQRYLADEPVHACPPSAGYRFRKFARRNKGALAVAGLVLFFIMLLGGVVGWGMRDRAVREREIALETARKLALTEEGIRQALDRASMSRAGLHAILKKPGGVQQLLNQPARWELLIKTARGELAQAQRLAARAEGSLDAEGTQAMDELAKQLTTYEGDYELALRLEKIRLDRATWVQGRFNNRKAADDYPKALAGFAVLSHDPAAVAARVASSPIKDQLVAALDDWALVASSLGKSDLAEQLLARARQAAPDPAWGDRLRQRKVWSDQEALRKLVAKAPAAGLSPQLLALVGVLLGGVDSPLTESWLRQAQAEHPADFWLNFGLANALKTNPVEAAGFYRVALAVRPGNSAAYNNLGLALEAQGKLDDAISCYHKAIAIDSRHAFAYNNLGNTLVKQQKIPAAIAAYHKAIEIDPKGARPHIGLGSILADQQKVGEAIDAFNKAIEIDPNDALAHYNLGLFLYKQRKLPQAIDELRKAIKLHPRYADAWDCLGVALSAQVKYADAEAAHRKAIEFHTDKAGAYGAYVNLGAVLGWQRRPSDAIAIFRKAIELKPDGAEAHYGLGLALGEQGNIQDSIGHFRTAIKLKPNYGHPYGNLGFALMKEGEFVEALAALKRSEELLPASDPGRSRIRQLIKSCTRFVELDGQLPAILKGEAQPASAVERTEFATVCAAKKLFVASARLYEEAFDKQPDLASEPTSLQRYNAARAAAQAGCRQGKDCAALRDAERAHWRKQALDWLRADLLLLDRRSNTPKGRAVAEQWLLRLQRSPDFDCVRVEDWLTGLPKPEQDQWRKVWAEVEALLGRVKSNAKPVPPPDRG
jgi:tetratricopeptide (TPR) repeat protein